MLTRSTHWPYSELRSAELAVRRSGSIIVLTPRNGKPCTFKTVDEVSDSLDGFDPVVQEINFRIACSGFHPEPLSG
jgi:hypothetical protein